MSMLNDLPPTEEAMQAIIDHARRMSELKTSEEWQKLYPAPRVLDPDGWDRKNFRFSWFEEKIDLNEFRNRVNKSTCGFRGTL